MGWSRLRGAGILTRPGIAALVPDKALRHDPTVAMRIDKWLWHTRFFKTRARATQAVRGGHVSVNGERARPSRPVAVGDVVDVVRDQLRFTVTVLEEPERRGPAKAAALCYDEHAESVARRESRLAQLRADRASRPATDGRPDKRTRKRLRELSRGQS